MFVRWSAAGRLNLNPKIRRLVWGTAGGVVMFLVVLFFAMRSLSAELEAKFYETYDSVPTRVYSALYWLRPGVGASAEEIRYRLKEREYRDVGSAEAVRAPGTFSLELDDLKRPASLVIFTNDFQYPAAAKEVLFGSAQAVVVPTRATVNWENGSISRVATEIAGEVPGFALEPILVAQLNEGNVQARRTVSMAQIPHTLMKGIVLTEDQRFLEHSGIDPRGIARSIYVNLKSGGYVQGASTITQQLARNIYLTRQKTIWRKLKEMAMSVMLEIKFSKDQILEKYLNEVYFGQSGNIAVHGVSEAAKFYFNKTLEELSVAEQALLAGIVRGPFYYSPFRHFERAKQRQEIVLTKMFEAGVITESQYKGAKNEKLKFARVSLVQNRAPYFTDMVQAQLLKDLPEEEVLGGGFTIFSTLDTYYQSLSEKAVVAGVAAIEGRIKQYVDKKKPAKSADPNAEGAPAEPETRLVQGVFISVDPATGSLLSLVGGRSYEESTYNRALLMRRQVGSLLKPFVYLSALINGRNPDDTPMNSISKFEDRPFTFEYDDKTWSPRNYDEDFAGTVTMRFALANSINTVAAQVAISTGLDNLVTISRQAGFETALQPLPSLSLGAVDVPPMEVATAYTTLANFGVRRELTATLAVVGEDGRLVARFQPRVERALPPEETANLVQLMTSVFDIGTASSARASGFGWPAAGKTGTTNEFRDAWFAGFSQKVLAITWIGFDRDDAVVRKHRQALKLTGAVAALPIWTEFMNGAHRNQPSQPLLYPEGMLRTLDVDLITGKRANFRCMGDSVVQEAFTHRNVPSEECN
jgi:penicillin-binding protein 1B